ncbi:uncharacterized protein [Dysidea avara]|uniref:uncharacterized protein isoform X2 n=1 Tax=Dysidea avara TaxID=196820 RepID=UPI003325385B
MDDNNASASVPGRKQSNPQHYSGVVVTPRYNSVSGRLRRFTSGTMQCSLFCGGSKCKYESDLKWPANDVAIPGLYSHWITDRVLAMARPSTHLIKEKNLIGEFKQAGIESVFNLQQPGEHKNCGPGLEESSGFTYQPEHLMSQGVFFYNYGWGDFGVPSIVNLLDMVKVFTFAVDQGKVAVHCHAGLGRTGVLVACHLIFSDHITSDQAVAHVRSKRPGSIQSPVQLQIVQEFYEYLRPKWIVFPSVDVPCVTLDQFMNNQRCILHGGDYRCYKYLPKVLCDICGRILDLCGVTTQFPWRTTTATTTVVTNGNTNTTKLKELCKSLSELELRAYLGGVGSDHVIQTDEDDNEELDLLVSPSNSVHDTLECSDLIGSNKTTTQSLNKLHLGNWLDNKDTIGTTNQLKSDLNNSQSPSGYSEVLSSISDVTPLLCLLLNWLDELKEPLLSGDDVTIIRHDYQMQLSQCGLSKEKSATLQVLSSTIQELSNHIEEVQQFVHHLSWSLIGCNRPASPIKTANKSKGVSDSYLLGHTHKPLKHSSSSSGDDHVISNLLLHHQHC